MIDYDEKVTVTNDDLKEISMLAEQLLELDQRILYHENVAKALKDDLLRISNDELPSAMHRCGMEKFTLQNGVEINVKKDVAVSIAKNNESDAFQWLIDNGHGAMVRTVEQFFFDKSDDEMRKKFNALIQKHPKFAALMQRKDAVNTNTLKAFFKNYLEEHGEIDDEVRKLFGVYDYKTAKLKLPKQFVF